MTRSVTSARPGRLRGHFLGCGVVQQETQNLPLRCQLGDAGPDRRVALSHRPLLLREHPLASRRKKDKNNPKDHRTKPQRAQEMVLQVAAWLPGKQLMVVGDSAYIGKHRLKGLPANVAALGPIHWKAKLTKPLPHDYSGRRKIGDALTAPKHAMDDDRWPWQELALHHPKGEKTVRVKILPSCCWYNSAGQRPLQVVLVRDPEQKWRDEALLCSDLGLSAEEVIVGYLRRWSVEVAYCDGKQLLGFHDPMVWSAKSVPLRAPDVLVRGRCGGAVVCPDGAARTSGCSNDSWSGPSLPIQLQAQKSSQYPLYIAEQMLPIRFTLLSHQRALLAFSRLPIMFFAAPSTMPLPIDWPRCKRNA